MASTTPPAPVTPERIMQLAWGYVPPLLIETAVRHHVFDLLDQGPKNISEMHAATGASERGLSAVMNALVGLNLLAKNGSGEYTLTPESAAFLVSTKPAFQGGLVRHTSNQLLQKWLQLNEIVATGKPATAVNDEASGAAFFQQLVPEIFPMSYPSAQTLAEALNLKQAQQPVSVLDIATGSGVWGIALAQSSSHVHVTAVDWPGVIPVTRKMVERFHLTHQFSFVESDMHAADFGANHNVATLGHILHSEGEESSRKLLAKVYKSLASGGTIAIAEFLVNDDRTGPPMGLIFAVNMLVNTEKGNTFSFGEIGSWLGDAGFINVRALPAPGPSPLILADKP